jgi:hypothetical protein
MTYSSVNAIPGMCFTQREVKSNATVNVWTTFTLRCETGSGQGRLERR